MTSVRLAADALAELARTYSTSIWLRSLGVEEGEDGYLVKMRVSSGYREAIIPTHISGVKILVEEV